MVAKPTSKTSSVVTGFGGPSQLASVNQLAFGVDNLVYQII